MDAIYLDNAATTPIAPEVRAAMEPWLWTSFGNPSSRHALGAAAARAIEEARSSVARVAGIAPSGVVFTSGGTEANNLGVIGLARAAASASKGCHVLLGPTEHPSVRASAQVLRAEGFEVEEARLGADAALDLDHLASSLRQDTVLVALMLVNNELGAIHPIRRVSRMLRGRAPHARLHVDAVQGLGKLDIGMEELGADSIAISAHKVHGPKGTGALLLRESVTPAPLLHGGNQERALRSGTENVAGIVGLGVAARLADEKRPEASAAYAAARAALRVGLQAVEGAKLLEFGAPSVGQVDGIAAISLQGPPAEVYLHHLEARGVYVSVGSACSARQREASPALMALGMGVEDAKRVLRVSFSRTTTAEDVTRATAVLAEVARELGAAVR